MTAYSIARYDRACVVCGATFNDRESVLSQRWANGREERPFYPIFRFKVCSKRCAFANAGVPLPGMERPPLPSPNAERIRKRKLAQLETQAAQLQAALDRLNAERTALSE